MQACKTRWISKASCLKIKAITWFWWMEQTQEFKLTTCRNKKQTTYKTAITWLTVVYQVQTRVILIRLTEVWWKSLTIIAITRIKKARAAVESTRTMRHQELRLPLRTTTERRSSRQVWARLATTSSTSRCHLWTRLPIQGACISSRRSHLLLTTVGDAKPAVALVSPTVPPKAITANDRIRVRSSPSFKTNSQQ